MSSSSFCEPPPTEYERGVRDERQRSLRIINAVLGECECACCRFLKRAAALIARGTDDEV